MDNNFSSLNLSLFIGNQSDRGIEDYVEWILGICESRNSSVSVDRRLRLDCRCIFWLDGVEVTSEHLDLLSQYRGLLVFLPTEWLCQKNGLLSLNCFNIIDMVTDKCILLFFGKLNFCLFVRIHCFLKKFFSVFKFLTYVNTRIDLCARLVHILQFAERVNIVLCPDSKLLHLYGDIMPNSISISAPPVIFRKSIEKILAKLSMPLEYKKCFFSGSLTPYRKKILKNKCNELIDTHRASLDVCDEYLSEVYIPQTAKWLHASIMRTYRTLRQGVLPVYFSPTSASPLTEFEIPYSWLALDNENLSDLAVILADHIRLVYSKYSARSSRSLDLFFTHLICL